MPNKNPVKKSKLKKFNLGTRNTKILFVVTLLVLGVLSYLSFGVVRDNMNDAKAASYAFNAESRSFVVYACKTNNGFGKYTVRGTYFRGSTFNSSQDKFVGIASYGNGTPYQTRSASFASNPTTFSLSGVAHNSIVNFTTSVWGGSNPSDSTGGKSMSSIPSC